MDWLTGKNNEAKKWIAQLNDPAKRATAANELLRLGPAAVDGLLEALVGKDAGLRTMAGQMLIKMGATAIPRLSEILASAHPETRQLVADILGEIRHPGAVPPLIDAARGQFFTIRSRAATALAKIGDPQAVPVLIDLLGDKEPSVRIAASLAVGKFQDPRCLVRLSDVLLEDPEIEVRQAAAQGLAASQLTQAIPYLIEAMQDSFWWYERDNATGPLLDSIAAFGADAVEPLTGALAHYEGTVRRNAALLLGRLGDTRAVEALGMTLYDMHYEVGRTAAESLAKFGAAALGVLGEALKHPESGIRLHALYALSQIRDARVLPLIAGALDDNDRLVQKQAIQSFADLGNAGALTFLEPIALDRRDRELSMLARDAMKQLSLHG